MKAFCLVLSTVSIALSASGATIQGTYTVPAGFGLEEPLDVPLHRARLAKSHGEISFDYRLPPELDGASPQRFRLKGPANADPLVLKDTRGDAVSASCTIEADTYRCNMQYHGPFTVNSAKALIFLQATGRSPADIAHLQRASASLQHQAAGIVTIPRD